MRKPEVWRLVLRRLLLSAKPNLSDNDWRGYIVHYLIPEIKAETQRFYGDNTSIESRHPGLDYANKGHRSRLAAFPHHKQLFGVFDKLRLTKDEIRELCKWKGTLFAKEEFERQDRSHIRDTTWDEIEQYHKPKPRAHVVCMRPSRQGGVATSRTACEIGFDEDASADGYRCQARETGVGDQQDGFEEAQRSQGVELHLRLADADMEAEWEQWMKEALERGDVSLSPDSTQIQALQTFANLDSRSPVQAQIPRGGTSPASSHTSSSTLSQADSDQSQRDPTTHTLNDDADTMHSSQARFSRPRRSSDPRYQVFRPPGLFSPDSETSTYQFPRFSTDSRSSSRPYAARSQILEHDHAPQTSFWGPAPFGDHSRSRSTALQEPFVHPTGYHHSYPSAGVISNSGSGHRSC